MRKASKATYFLFILFIGILGMGPFGCGSSGGSSGATALSVSQALALALAGINSVAVVGNDCPNGGSYTTTEEQSVTFSSCAFENYAINGGIALASGADTFTLDLTVNSEVVGDFSVTGGGSIMTGEGGNNTFDETGTFGDLSGRLEGSITGGQAENSSSSGSITVTSGGSTILSCSYNTTITIYNLSCETLAGLCGVSASACE